MQIQRLNESKMNEVFLHFKNAQGNFLINDINNELFVIGVAVNRNDEITGVIFSEYKDSEKMGVIYSVNVKEKFLNQNIEEKLLKFAEKELKTKGARVLYTNIFPETSPTVKFSLRKLSWTPPQIEKTHLVININEMQQEKWIETNRFPQDFAIKEWHQISEMELETLRNADWYPKHLSPLETYHFGEMSPHTSFWVSYKDEIVGWILGNKVDNDYLFITSLFIKEEWRNHYILRPLLGEVIKNQIRLKIPYACFDVRNQDQRVLRFFKRFFKNYIHHTIEIHSTHKLLRR